MVAPMSESSSENSALNSPPPSVRITAGTPAQSTQHERKAASTASGRLLSTSATIWKVLPTSTALMNWSTLPCTSPRVKRSMATKSLKSLGTGSLEGNVGGGSLSLAHTGHFVSKSARNCLV